MTRFFVLAALFQVAVIAVLPSEAFAQTPGDRRAMTTANQLYNVSQFEEASQLYQQLVDRGFRNSAIYYNLGNAYYKQGNPGRAVLSYIRAESLAPRDPDLRSNLALAREQATDRLDFEDQMSLDWLAYLTRPWATLNEMALATLCLWLLLVLLLIGVLVRRRGLLRRLMGLALTLALIAFVASAVLFGNGTYVESRGQIVIVETVVEVLGGPGASYPSQFTLHSGAEATLLERRGSWVRLERPGTSQRGWVQATAVETVAH